eukprot:TRINITY_DN54245_c0_g1_i1.p2 TRINITY_DN54245_c0_g1~~TRINITY_DN54245_c0_g1_i1.p2  ORF type:complete len:149 (+),score=7.93 TRINITY_DN54245_c0_g1_i1:76-522(+)
MYQIINFYQFIMEQNLVQTLVKAKGYPTSMVTLCLPPTVDLNNVQRKLAQELMHVTSIKSRKNRKVTEQALVKIRELLETYEKVPNKGLVICSGIMILEGNEKFEEAVTTALEPFNSEKVGALKLVCSDHFDIPIGAIYGLLTILFQH